MNVKNRIGIITWHYYPNFGSALQAYALHTYINNRGGDAMLINYVRGKKPTFYKLRLCLSHFDRLIPRFLSKKIHYRFLSFERDFFKETRIVSTKQDLSLLTQDFDVFICGSDQIWAPNVFDETYMLSFVPSGKKKISYAASIGLPTIPNEVKAIYKKLLSNFDAISVREQQGQELLKKEFNIDSVVVLDPTLLITNDQWKRIAIYPTHPPKYILCYFLGKNEEHRLLAEQFAKKLQLKIICLSRYSIDKRSTFITDVDAGPREFIGYIQNAEYIITDSFHGLCFSINLNKDFYVVNRFSSSDPINQNSRIENILRVLDLKGRLIESLPTNIESIDYDKVNKLLAENRMYSYQFLSEHIGL